MWYGCESQTYLAGFVGAKFALTASCKASQNHVTDHKMNQTTCLREQTKSES
jgi:hypothetical protein